MNENLQRASKFEDPAIAVLCAGMPQLSEDEREALRHINVVHRFLGRGHALLEECADVTHVRVLCKGWAMRCRWLDGERRQVLDFVLPGDLVGLHLDGLGTSICDVISLTACEVGEIDAAELDRVAFRHRGVASGLNRTLSRQLTQANDQILRLGRMTAYEQVCSILLDIHARQRMTASIDRSVDFPITQTVVADMLGLSVVHVNRQVMRLRREGLVTLNRRRLIIHDEKRLAEVARYQDRRYTRRPAVFMAAE